MQPYRQVTDEEWARVEPLIPELKYNPTRDPRGRPMTSRRDCLNATIWVMYSGASWQSLPRRYPSYQTCHRSFKAWYDAGVMHRIARTLFGKAAESFLEVVSARIRSGTKARQALNAAMLSHAATTGRSPAGRQATTDARGNRGTRAKGRKAGERSAAKGAAGAKPRSSAKRAKGVPALVAQERLAEKGTPPKALARKTAVRGVARAAPVRAARENAAPVGPLAPRDAADARLAARKARARAGARSPGISGPV